MSSAGWAGSPDARDDVTVGARRFDLIVDTAGNRPLARLRRVLNPAGTLV